MFDILSPKDMALLPNRNMLYNTWHYHLKTFNTFLCALGGRSLLFADCSLSLGLTDCLHVSLILLGDFSHRGDASILGEWAALRPLGLPECLLEGLCT